MLLPRCKKGYVKNIPLLYDMENMKEVMIMLTALFILAFVWFMWKIIALAIKMTWGLLKVGIYVIFLPIVIIGLFFGGLIYIALPLAIIGGIIALAISK